MTIIKVQTVYYGNDTLGDYDEIRIVINNVLHISYGSQYDDKGKEKAEGFLDGFCAAMPSCIDLEIEYEDVLFPDEDGKPGGEDDD